MDNTTVKNKLIATWDEVHAIANQLLDIYYDSTDALLGEKMVTPINRCNHLLEDLSFILKGMEKKRHEK